MKCPACSKETEKLSRGGLCPNIECKAPLKIVKREDDGGNLIKSLEFRKKRDTSSVKEDPEIFEIIHQANGAKVEKSNKDNYIVTYYRRANFSWIYCPHCESKMFQNNTLSGSNEHKCHKCKKITTYVFTS